MARESVVRGLIDLLDVAVKAERRRHELANCATECPYRPSDHGFEHPPMELGDEPLRASTSALRPRGFT